MKKTFSSYIGLHTPYLIDTTPGSGGAMAPWSGFKGGFFEYADEIKRRYEKDIEARRHMLIAATAMKPGSPDSPVQIRGSYADSAKRLLMILKKHLQDNKQSPPKAAQDSANL